MLSRFGKYIAAIFITGLVFIPVEAFALCESPSIQPGTYVNLDRNARSITTVRLDFVCIDNIPIPADASDEEIRRLREDAARRSGTFIRIWGKCHPRDCDWGSVRTSPSGPAMLLAFYNQGFARRGIRVVKLGTSSIRVVVDTVYSDSRPRASWSVIMRRTTP